MDKFKVIATVLTILITTYIYNILSVPNKILCKSKQGDVIGILSGKNALILGRVDDDAAKCISKKWGMNTNKIRLLFVPESFNASNQDKCKIDGFSRKDRELTKIWRELCRARKVIFGKKQIMKYSFEDNKLHQFFNSSDSENYVHLILEESSKSMKHIMIFDINDGSINTKKYNYNLISTLVVDQEGFLKEIRSNEEH